MGHQPIEGPLSLCFHQRLPVCLRPHNSRGGKTSKGVGPMGAFWAQIVVSLCGALLSYPIRHSGASLGCRRSPLGKLYERDRDAAGRYEE